MDGYYKFKSTFGEDMSNEQVIPYETYEFTTYNINDSYIVFVHMTLIPSC